jgi:hypothetical protein
VRDCFQGALAAQPKSITDHVRYAKWALLAGHPDVAQQQLDAVNSAAADPIFKDYIAQPKLRAAITAALKARPATK